VTAEANLRHWRDADRGVYEVWYLTWNHAASDQGFWLRFVTEAPVDGPPRAELWFARFDRARPERTFAFHRAFELARFAAGADPFEVVLAGCSLGHDHTFGELAGAGHDVRWDLRWDPAPAVLRHLPDVMYGGGGRGETTVQSPNPRVAMSGTLVVDGEQLRFDRAVLGQTHLWGTKHAFSWTWGRCAEFAGAPDAVLELLGVKLQRRGITTPPLFLLALDLDGERYRFNQFRHTVRNRARWGGTHVEFVAHGARIRIEGTLACRAEQMVLAPYLDPDGTRVYCANTEIGDVQLVVSERAGLRWRERRRLQSSGRAHFEIGGRQRDLAVTTEHVRV
jgi:hypothetical protein